MKRPEGELWEGPKWEASVPSPHWIRAHHPPAHQCVHQNGSSWWTKLWVATRKSTWLGVLGDDPRKTIEAILWVGIGGGSKFCAKEFEYYSSDDGKPLKISEEEHFTVHQYFLFCRSSEGCRQKWNQLDYWNNPDEKWQGTMVLNSAGIPEKRTHKIHGLWRQKQEKLKRIPKSLVRLTRNTVSLKEMRNCPSLLRLL